MASFQVLRRDCGEKRFDSPTAFSLQTNCRTHMVPVFLGGGLRSDGEFLECLGRSRKLPFFVPGRRIRSEDIENGRQKISRSRIRSPIGGVTALSGLGGLLHGSSQPFGITGGPAHPGKGRRGLRFLAVRNQQLGRFGKALRFPGRGWPF